MTKNTIPKKTFDSSLFWALVFIWFIYINIHLPTGFLTGSSSDAAGNAMSQGLGFLFVTFPLSLIILIINVAILMKESSSLKLKKIAYINSLVLMVVFLFLLF